MSSRHDTGWDRIYHNYAPQSLPWELGKPRKGLVRLVESGHIVPGKTLDLCCGAGTNPIYLATRGFDVTAIEISDSAVDYARENAQSVKAELSFLIADYLNLPFKNRIFHFIFDFGCFHHVQAKDRHIFIEEVHRVLKPKSPYFLACFSYRNGPGWNNFTEEQIINLFGGRFIIKELRHASSLEADKAKRYFYETLMEKID